MIFKSSLYDALYTVKITNDKVIALDPDAWHYHKENEGNALFLYSNNTRHLSVTVQLTTNTYTQTLLGSRAICNMLIYF